VQKRTLAETPNTRRTAFDTFKASADVLDGVATTKDLAIASQLLRVSGQGSTNLVTQALDYALTVTVLKAPPSADAGLSELALATIPVKVTGSFEDPKVRPDLAGLAKARVQKEIDKRKDEIKEKLQDKLKGLFNR
jgi:AsmA protein